MPIPVQDTINEHVPNGVTTVFAFTFAILDAEDLKVKLDGSPYTAFTISGIGSRTGGSITCTSAPTGSSLLLYRDVSLERTTDYQELGDLLAETLDDDFDRAWMALQDVDAANDRTLRVPLGETLPELPAASSRDGYLAFVSGTPVLIDPPSASDASALALSLADDSGANLIGWIRAAVGAVAYTVGDFLGWVEPNVLEFMSIAQRIDYLSRAGSIDVTSAVQAAENAATGAGRVLTWPSGCALITDQISRGTGSQWVGQHKNQGLPAFVNGTKIKFQPSTTKDLWVPSGAPSLYRVGYCTEGFHIAGNANARYCWDVHGINKSLFRHLTIDGFQTGVRNYATIHNTWECVSITNCSVASVLYDGGVSTTDVWDKYYFANAPMAVQTNGSNVAIRFKVGTVESMTSYVANIVKESQLMFGDIYTEDIGTSGAGTVAAFRVGYDGTTLAGAPQLIVMSGIIGGRNAGGVGSAFDIDSTDGIVVGGGLLVTRWTNGIKTTVNTLTAQVVSLGWVASSVSTLVTDDSKVTAFFPQTVFNGSGKNAQTHRFMGDSYTAPGGNCTGAITTSANWTLTKDGNVVTLKLPTVTGTASASPSFTFADVIPAKYRPSASLAFTCPIKNNGANQATPGVIAIDYLTGSITVYKDGTLTSNFTAAANAGLGAGSGTGVSWTV